MWRQRRLLPLLVAALALATGLAACGEKKRDRKSLLSSGKAAELRSTLDSVEQMVDDGDCEGAQDATLALQQQVDELPASVDTNLRDTLRAGANRLETLVANGCQPQEPAGTTPAPAPPAEQPVEKQKEKKPKKQKDEQPAGDGNQGDGGQDGGQGGTQTGPQEQTGGAEG